MAEIPQFLALGLRLTSAALPSSSRESAPFLPRKYLTALLESVGNVRWNTPLAQACGLSQAIDSLSSRDRQRLAEHFGEEQLAALLALQTEEVPELFFRGLLLVGRKLVETGREQVAWGLYRLLEASASVPELANQAGKSRNLLEGKGSFSDQTESFFRGFVKEVIDYRNVGPALTGAFLGSMFYNLTRFKASCYLSKALRAQVEVFPLDIVIAKFQSRGVGLLAGAAISTLSEQGLHHLAGEPDSLTPKPMLRTYAASLLNLFAWRLSVALFDEYRLSAVANNKDKIIRKNIESFLLSQALATTCLGVAMVASPSEMPKSRPAISARLFHELLGMNLGRMVGKTGLRMFVR